MTSRSGSGSAGTSPSRRKISMALSRPVGIAADSGNESTYLVLCEDGKVYTTDDGGQHWVEVMPIPGSRRESERSGREPGDFGGIATA